MNDVREFYSRYAKDIFRFALYLCGNASEAEDIVGETFARVIISKSKLVSGTVKGYLLTTARNYYLESIRKNNAGMQAQTLMSETGLLQTQGLTETLENTEQQKNDLQTVECFFQTWSELERSIYLFRLDGLSFKEISTITGLSESAAKVKVHRAKIKLNQWRQTSGI
jgi:RNA polymerase sigma-70 factor, ECF subfamily